MHLERGHCPVCASRRKDAYVASAIGVAVEPDGTEVFTCTGCKVFVHRVRVADETT